jgi:hypothetical protein
LGERSRIRNNDYLHVRCHPNDPTAANDFDPYNLSEPYPDGLRTLELKGIRLFPFIFASSTILLRDEYITMYNEVVSDYQGRRGRREPGVVVTGQQGLGRPNFLRSTPVIHLTVTSGTGKSVFLFYVLLLRILDAKPTVLRYDAGLAVGFTQYGVEILGEESSFEARKRI